MTETKDVLALEGGVPVRPRDRYIVFGRPVIGPAEINAVVECLRSRWIGTGPRVARFESEFASFTGAGNAVAVNSCTAALHLSMLASGIGPGDEVVTTPMTFCATVNAIIHTGATPVLADCDPHTGNILPEAIEAAITSRTRAIVVVHFAGRCCDMDAIMSLARKRGLRVVEDCAHAVEARYGERHVGTIGDIGCFSFYATKNLTTGEGGMVVTDDDALAASIRTLGLHGMSKDAWKRFSDDGYKHYQVIQPGFKYNMTDMQAAIGLEQLKQIEPHWRRRQQIWQIYDDALTDLPCQRPAPISQDSRHGLHLYTPLLDLDRLTVSRDRVLEALDAEGIGVGVHYLPVHTHPYYVEHFGWRTGDFPGAEHLGARTLSLPLTGDMDAGDVDDVCTAFARVLRYYQR